MVFICISCYTTWRWDEWVSSFLTAHQHNVGYTLPKYDREYIRYYFMLLRDAILRKLWHWAKSASQSICTSLNIECNNIVQPSDFFYQGRFNSLFEVWKLSQKLCCKNPLFIYIVVIENKQFGMQFYNRIWLKMYIRRYSKPHSSISIPTVSE